MMHGRLIDWDSVVPLNWASKCRTEQCNIKGCTLKPVLGWCFLTYLHCAFSLGTCGKTMWFLLLFFSYLIA